MKKEQEKQKPYPEDSALELFQRRIPWLLFLMISATVTGQIIFFFENSLAAQAALISFIPMIMDTGGNSGNQATITVIRSISMGEIGLRDLSKVVRKEMKVAGLCGSVLAAVNFLKIVFLDNLLFQRGISLLMAAVVCGTLFLTVLIAKLVGCTLPLLARSLGSDPAVLAGPMVTTVVDAVSLMIYCAIAAAVL